MYLSVNRVVLGGSTHIRKTVGTEEVMLTLHAVGKEWLLWTTSSPALRTECPLAVAAG